jgi:hypothetical protein
MTRHVAWLRRCLPGSLTIEKRMNVPKDNAFIINSLAGAFFPFSTRVSRKGDVSRISLCPLRVIDILDIVEAHVMESVAVFGVGQASRFDERTGDVLPLDRLAAEALIDYERIDADTIVLSRKYLFPLLSYFAHYDLSLFDLEDGWDETRVIGQVLAFRGQDWDGPQHLLSGLPASRLVLDCHDDCYLTVESFDRRLPGAIFGRALQLYAGTLLGDTLRSAVDIPEVPGDLLDAFWMETIDLTILKRATEVGEDGLRIGVSRKAYDFRNGQGTYPVDFRITYRIAERKWGVEI